MTVAQWKAETYSVLRQVAVSGTLAPTPAGVAVGEWQEGGKPVPKFGAATGSGRVAGGQPGGHGYHASRPGSVLLSTGHPITYSSPLPRPGPPGGSF
eukprot:3273453-Rhodomonas_salina.3